MKKSSKNKHLKKIKIWNENFQICKSILISKLIFSRLVYLEVLEKKLNYGGMNMEMEKKCELQHHFVLFYWKILDLDCKNGLSFALFGWV